MPWCEPCARYWAPSAMRADGACPSCGAVPAQAEASGRPRRGTITGDTLDLRSLARSGEPGSERVPGHFTLLMVLLVAYLGWRVVDLFV